MSYQVEFAASAVEDLRRLYKFLLDRAEFVEDLDLAERALEAIETAATIYLAQTPMIFRKAAKGGDLRRELIVPCGATGYVILYEIAGPDKVVVLAVRHQREEDYH